MKLFDTSVLIFFLREIGEFDCINHLCHMDEDINISEEVYNEYIEDYIKEKLTSNQDLRGLNTLNDYIMNDKIKMLIMEIESLKENIKRRYPTLGEGELSIIAIGLLIKENNNNYCCVLDDGTARFAAAKYNLELTGSIGLLINIRDNNGWDNKKMLDIIEAIQNSDFRASDELLGRLLW